MIKCEQLRSYIIQPALKAMGDYSPGIEEMLVAICAQESLGGTFLKQEHGTAVGIYQMEPKTHDDIWDRELIGLHRGEMVNVIVVPNSVGKKILMACDYLNRPKAEVMIYNLWYATMMARAFWLNIHEEIPNHDDLETIWTQYKKYWNTEAGKATKDQFFENYRKFTGNER